MPLAHIIEFDRRKLEWNGNQRVLRNPFVSDSFQPVDTGTVRSSKKPLGAIF